MRKGITRYRRVSGGRIRSARTGEGMSIEALADAVGVSRAAVGFYESGLRVPGANVVCNIADVLGVTIDELYEYID